MDALPFRSLHAHRSRLLTAGEIAIVSLLFRDATDYRRVRIDARRHHAIPAGELYDNAELQSLLPSFLLP